MRAPLDYGDNFPVPSGYWSPTVPWRFPHIQASVQAPLRLKTLLPWLMLVLGVSLGILIARGLPGALPVKTGGAVVPSAGESAGQAVAPNVEAPAFDPAKGQPRLPQGKVKTEFA